MIHPSNIYEDDVKLQMSQRAKIKYNFLEFRNFINKYLTLQNIICLEIFFCFFFSKKFIFKILFYIFFTEIS